MCNAISRQPHQQIAYGVSNSRAYYACGFDAVRGTFHVLLLAFGGKLTSAHVLGEVVGRFRFRLAGTLGNGRLLLARAVQQCARMCSLEECSSGPNLPVEVRGVICIAVVVVVDVDGLLAGVRGVDAQVEVVSILF